MTLEVAIMIEGQEGLIVSAGWHEGEHQMLTRPRQVSRSVEPPAPPAEP